MRRTLRYARQWIVRISGWRVWRTTQDAGMVYWEMYNNYQADASALIWYTADDFRSLIAKVCDNSLYEGVQRWKITTTGPGTLPTAPPDCIAPRRLNRS